MKRQGREKPADNTSHMGRKKNTSSNSKSMQSPERSDECNANVLCTAGVNAAAEEMLSDRWKGKC